MTWLVRRGQFTPFGSCLAKCDDGRRRMGADVTGALAITLPFLVGQIERDGRGCVVSSSLHPEFDFCVAGFDLSNGIAPCEFDTPRPDLLGGVIPNLGKENLKRIHTMDYGLEATREWFGASDDSSCVQSTPE